MTVVIAVLVFLVFVVGVRTVQAILQVARNQVALANLLRDIDAKNARRAVGVGSLKGDHR